MSRIQIRPGIRFVHENNIYIIQRQLADNQFQIENASTGDVNIQSYDDLVQAWAGGDIRFEVTGSNTCLDAEVPLRTRYMEDDLQDLPQSVQARVWERYEWVLAVYQHYSIHTVQMLSRQQIRSYLANHNIPTSVSSLERYVRAFVNSGGDIRSLIPQTQQRGGKGQSRLDDRVEEIIAQVLGKYTHITERVSTVDQVVTDIVNQIADENRFREPDDRMSLPSERTIRRRIKAVGEQHVLGRRLSRREQQAEAATQPGPRPLRILERVEIDHTTLDLFVVDETDGLPVGRPHITACIDKYSGLVPGWHIGFNHGGYESIMLCLQHAFLPKPDYRKQYGTEHNYPVHGLFEKLCIDNGRDFKSHDLQVALAELGILREEMPKETPWFKGSIERYFRRVNQQLLQGKPGHTFGNVVALGDYDAQKDAVISLTAFLEIFHIFMVDVYPYTWHRGLEAVPMQRWQDNAMFYPPDLFEDATALQRILLPGAERTLQPRGIEWEHNFYRGPELPRLRELHSKQKVRFKYNPDNMNVIYVRDRSSASGWAEFHSTNPDYTEGLSLAKHRVIRQLVSNQRQSIDRVSLARAKAHIQQVIDREFFTTRKLRRRSRLKPLLEPDTTPEVIPKLEVLPPKSRKPPVSEDEWVGDTTGWSVDYELPFAGQDDHE